MNDRSGTGRHARRLDGPTASARFVNQQARQVAARFKELHPEVHVDVDDLAADAAAAVYRWARRHEAQPTERRTLALMRSEMFRHITDRPR